MQQAQHWQRHQQHQSHLPQRRAFGCQKRIRVLVRQPVHQLTQKGKQLHFEDGNGCGQNRQRQQRPAHIAAVVVDKLQQWIGWCVRRFLRKRVGKFFKKI